MRKSSTKSTPRKSIRRKSTKANGSVSPKEWEQMVAEAAYYRAEKRGFSTGEELRDWLAAEKEIDRQIRSEEYR